MRPASASRRCPRQTWTTSMRRRLRRWSASGSGWRRTRRSTCSPTAAATWIATRTSSASHRTSSRRASPRRRSSFVLCGRDPDERRAARAGRVGLRQLHRGARGQRPADRRAPCVGEAGHRRRHHRGRRDVRDRPRAAAGRRPRLRARSERARLRRGRPQHHQARARAGDQQGRDRRPSSRWRP